MGNRLVAASGQGDSGKEGNGCGYKGSTCRIFLMLEMFCLLRVVVDARTKHVTKLQRTKYTHVHKISTTGLKEAWRLTISMSIPQL